MNERQNEKRLAPVEIKSALELYNPVVSALADRKKGLIASTASPFRALAKYIPYFFAGDLVVVAGRPSMGKTALALNFALSFAKIGNVLVFSLEMSIDQLIIRLLSTICKVSMNTIQHDKEFAWQDHKPALQASKEALGNLYIDDTSLLTPELIGERVAYFVEQHKIVAVVVDYLQLMKVPGEDSREREIAECSLFLKALAKTYKVPVFALSQLNRGLEQRGNKRPVLADLRDSGAIEQDADIVIFIFREDYYNQNAVEGETELIVAKHRNGPTGHCTVMFDAPTTTFFDLGGQK